MKREDILHLADLARIQLTEEEIERFSKEFDAILGYVATIKELAGEGVLEKKVGALHTVLREDEGAHEGDVYTEDLLQAAPDRVGRYVRVKKILGG